MQLDNLYCCYMAEIICRVACSAVVLFCTISACLGGEVMMKIDELLSKEIESARLDGHAVPVIITMRSAEDVTSLVARGIKPSVAYQNIPAVAAVLTPAQIEEIAAMPQVERIELDSEANALRKP